MPVAVKDISFFYTNDRNTTVYLKDGHTYRIVDGHCTGILYNGSKGRCYDFSYKNMVIYTGI